MEDANREPKVRHEFVGMMFAVTIGEVGLQVASLVQAKHLLHFLPFYSHLVLAVVIITTSWVGWTLSSSPGARKDVGGTFTWGFVTLLLDVALVITYFIIVRTIEVGRGKELSRVDPPSTLAALMCLMFVIYLIWDVVTKVIVHRKPWDVSWLGRYGTRIIPTALCLAGAEWLHHIFLHTDLLHYVNADLAMLGLALLFRALKDVTSSSFPSDGTRREWSKLVRSVCWSAMCIMIVAAGVISAKPSCHLLPASVATEIESSLPGKDMEKPSAEMQARPQSSPGRTLPTR